MRNEEERVNVTGLQTYFSSNEWKDVHLPRLALLDRGNDEAGATQDDLPSGPAVHRELQLPFTDVVCPGQLDPLGALDVLWLLWKEKEKRERERGTCGEHVILSEVGYPPITHLQFHNSRAAVITVEIPRRLRWFVSSLI